MNGGGSENFGLGVILVVPCYNEANRWQPDFWRELLTATDANILFVDDGSTDSTRRTLAEYADEPRVRVIHLDENSGKAEAVRHGLLLAFQSGQMPKTLIGFLDADGAFEPCDIARMIELAQSDRLDGFDALISSRVALSGRRVIRSMRRHYVGRIVATLLSTAEPDLPYDSQSGFKLFRATPEFAHCLAAPFRTRWLFDVEILARWRKSTGRSMMIWEEPVLSWNDIPGSKIRGGELLRIVKELLIVNGESRNSLKST